MDRHFHVAHQSVTLDVDLAHWSIRGSTTLIITPTSPDLKLITLDCRQSTVLHCAVNSRQASFSHNHNFNFAHPTVFPPGSTVHQHAMYSHAISDLMAPTLPGELSIALPRGVKIAPIRDMDNVAQPVSSKIDLGLFSPLEVTVEFELRNPIMGFVFIGGLASNVKKSYWHAYTTNSPMGVATSSWLPCVDGLWERCTWQFEISVPRTIRDLNPILDTEMENNMEMENDMEMETKPPATASVAASSSSASSSAATTITPGTTTTSTDKDNDEDEDRDIIVACCGSLTPTEVAHISDPRKKTVSFSIPTPVSANYIGFAVGPFVQTSLPNLRDDEDEVDLESSANKAPVALFSLVDRVADTTNACIFIYRAMEYFCREYGSFPFASLSLVFVSDLPDDYNSMAGLTICSDKLVFPPEVIEPLFSSTEILASALASQWCSVNIIPKTWNDLWITTGLSYFMAGQFIRKLLGNNEYRFKLKKKTERICDLDIGRPPIADPQFSFPITQKSLDFITLKAPVVLFILDRRMTKTDKSFGLSRVIPKIFLQALSGDLPNSALSTQHFIKVCEKVSYHKLDSFFAQWVFGAGYPIFRVTQRFNKKRMFIEMGIRQVQMIEIPAPPIHEQYFVDDAKALLDGKTVPAIQTVFQGPMTIRIHEADGTPYEHVVDLKESFTKLDIQYNTKYKRLKRNQREKSHVDLSTVDQADDADLEGVLLHCLGDVLQTDNEVEDWKLTDWTKDEEDRMTNEAFEWIRVDADFEWICKLYINQPDYMFASQLQQDRDVVAQYESVIYFSEMKPSRLYSSILTRTLMDKRYYYGIRSEAAYALAKMAVPEIDFIGSYHLIKAFQAMFCFEGSTIPDANNFADFPNYFIQKSIPKALSTIRDTTNGQCPPNVKNFLLDLLRYNENSSNSFSDAYYVCDLIQSIVMAYPKTANAHDSVTTQHFITKALSEIERYQRLDGWIPSYQNMVTIAALRGKEALVRAGHTPPKFEELIQYTRAVNNNDVRLCAFQIMLNLGALKNRYLLHYTFTTAALDPSGYVRAGLIEAFSRALGVVALYGDFDTSAGHSANGSTNLVGDGTDNSNRTTAFGGGSSLVIVEEGSSNPINARRELIARSSISGALQLLKQNLGPDPVLQREIWDAINSPLHTILEKRTLLNICAILYDPKPSFMVHLPTPRPKKLAAKYLGDGKLVIKREGRFKLHMKKAVTTATTAATTKTTTTTTVPLIIKSTAKKAPTAAATAAATTLPSLGTHLDSLDHAAAPEPPRKILKISLPKRNIPLVSTTTTMAPAPAVATAATTTTVSAGSVNKRPFRIVTNPPAPSQVRAGTALEFKGPNRRQKEKLGGSGGGNKSKKQDKKTASSSTTANKLKKKVIIPTTTTTTNDNNDNNNDDDNNTAGANTGNNNTLKFKFKELDLASASVGVEINRPVSPMSSMEPLSAPVAKKPKLKIKFKAPPSS